MLAYQPTRYRVVVPTSFSNFIPTSKLSSCKENPLAQTCWYRVQPGAVLALPQRANRMRSCAQ